MNTRRSSSLVVALVALASLGACGQDESTTAQEDPTSLESTSTQPEQSDSSTAGPLALTADGSAAGKCAVPSAQTLATFDTAFAGTVTALDEGTATLSVEQWYVGGDDASTVTVSSPSEALRDLLLAVDFEQGKSYLVSATGDRVTLCGFTAEQTPDLQALYDEAFTQ